MKKYLAITGLLLSVFISAQAFNGGDDYKIGIGFENAKNGRGLNITADKGLGENISVGISGTYLLSADDYIENGVLTKPTAIHKLDLKARASVHLYNIISYDSNFDVYPGINLGIKNLGVHTGVRYFFNQGIGIYSEIDFPIADFQDSDLGKDYYNGFKFRIGVSVNL